ncbi:MAG: CDF family Co(II)/Ni(II) efflux transporter DmeF [Candidatus Omnitrophica bacterium]|nr:CDF family Co(II)/Ni(II) efflux transporter DmeF [Candidatus Omnitrophota bacterium]MDE2008861.1 CDF family Co(II)/Ni(II) efflux transporter DmeF [Candidatus Omnitrophota bacterium]MDE2213576.1 CDF family Co(II)/Ni(II) efflux transporter DmeF [Candidatus Omnitrophota bacterium]MDE2230523.1 CDF family Co(II)/Ni(II) efflux transporter DmeF [Candidatus Omnitrophota bacterium]
MHKENLHFWQHDHVFGQEQKRSGEGRTMLVIGITGAMMIVEIIAGLIFGSMALLAEGLHMASHTVALMINVFAYIYARRHARDESFTFGTGKVNALGGFSGAVLLVVFAIAIAWGSLQRVLNPVPIAFNQAILVAVIGLVVNGASALILGDHDNGEHEHDHHHEHAHHDHHDHNLKSAYIHVLSDAFVAMLAVVALVMAKYFHFIWMDPLMGIVAAIVVCRWSVGLLKTTSAILLDKQGANGISRKIRESIESVGDNRIADLHLWAIGSNMYAAVISIVTHHPQQPEYYKKLIPSDLGLAHITIEVNRCPESEFVKGVSLV